MLTLFITNKKAIARLTLNLGVQVVHLHLILVSLILLFSLDLSDLGVLGLAKGLGLITPLSLLALVVGAESVDLGVEGALLVEELVLMLIAHL